MACGFVPKQPRRSTVRAVTTIGIDMGKNTRWVPSYCESGSRAGASHQGLRTYSPAWRRFWQSGLTPAQTIRLSDKTSRLRPNLSAEQASERATEAAREADRAENPRFNKSAESRPMSVANLGGCHRPSIDASEGGEIVAATLTGTRHRSPQDRGGKSQFPPSICAAGGETYCGTIGLTRSQELCARYPGYFQVCRCLNRMVVDGGLTAQ
jgi:hypothetical protein